MQAYTKTFKAHLESSKDWARIAAHADRLLRLQRIYERVAPENLARLSRVANYKTGKVVISALNGAVAAKLNQIAPSLAVGFSRQGTEVTQVEVRVQVAVHHKLPPAVEHRSMGDLTRLRIRKAAAALPADSELRKRLMHLADRGG